MEGCDITLHIAVGDKLTCIDIWHTTELKFYTIVSDTDLSATIIRYLNLQQIKQRWFNVLQL